MAFSSISGAAPAGPAVANQAAADLWLRAAAQDYRVCRAFRDRFHAALGRSLRGQRVGWEREGQPGYALLLPDILPATSAKNDEWYLYSVTGQAFFHWTQAQRTRMKALVLADCVEDWAELLRQAVRDHVFDVRYEVTPQYLLGEYDVSPAGAVEAEETLPFGYLFSLRACAPQAASPAPFQRIGSGLTPEEAARDACVSWLQEQCPAMDLV